MDGGSSGPGALRFGLIQLTPGYDGSFALLASDTGVRIPEQVDLRNPPSLGLTLLDSLVRQFEGTIDFDRKGGQFLPATACISTRWTTPLSLSGGRSCASFCVTGCV